MTLDFGDKNNKSIEDGRIFGKIRYFCRFLTTTRTMKKLLLSVSLLACLAAFNACTTDVELYADYKEIPVVYGLLDVSQDTNYVRINRAFSGSNDNPINAHEVALIADSSNYPGKLKAYLAEYVQGYGGHYESTGRTLELDTITIHDKMEGTFYSPDQKVYWTKERLQVNNGENKYKYKLYVHLDNDTVTAETNLVGGEGFKITTGTLSFMAEENDFTSQIKFTLAANAVFYDMRMVFYYRESVNGGPMTEKQVSYSFGAKAQSELGHDNNSNIYYVSYDQNTLFHLLEEAIGGDTIIDPNHPNVVRYFDPKPMKVFMSAGGDELYTYIQVNQQTGYSQSIPDYTNVIGGYGVFSSRINLTKDMAISSSAQRDLYAKSWGFVEQ